jgi:hypothetical protein
LNPSPWRADFDQQLRRASSLPENADEWSPKRPSPNVVKVVDSLIGEIRRTELPPPLLTVAADGSVHVKWRKGSRQFSVMVLPDETVEYCFVEAGRVIPEEGTLAPHEFSRVNEFLAWLLIG